MDLKVLDPQWFRKKIAMVGQEPTLFASSIKDNIAYGCCATDQEVNCNFHVILALFFFSRWKKEREGPRGKRGRGQEERGRECCAGLSVFSPYVTSFFRTPRLTISNFIYWFLEKKDDSY